MQKYHSNIRCRDTNPRSCGQESPPITTRPGFPPVVYKVLPTLHSFVNIPTVLSFKVNLVLLMSSIEWIKINGLKMTYRRRIWRCSWAERSPRARLYFRIWPDSRRVQFRAASGKGRSRSRTPDRRRCRLSGTSAPPWNWKLNFNHEINTSMRMDSRVIVTLTFKLRWDASLCHNETSWATA